MNNALRERTDDILAYYRSNAEAGRFCRQQLEYLVTLQALVTHIPPGARVLEIGAGAGTYTRELALRGHSVVAYDFCPELIERNREEMRALGTPSKVEFIVADARDVGRVLADRKFDAVLVMGPLYHLERESEREGLLHQVRSLLAPGGTLITAHMSRVGFVGHVLLKTPSELATRGEGIAEVFRRGKMSQHPRSGQFRGYWSTIGEAKELHERKGFEVQRLVAQDPCLGSLDEHFNSFSVELKALWASFLFELSILPEALGACRHFLCVSRLASAPARSEAPRRSRK